MNKTIKEVLDNLESLITQNKAINIKDNAEKLNIKHYLKNKLYVTDLKKMRVFIKNALKNGYNGTVYFIVGNGKSLDGMWALKEMEYDVNSDFLYHSFKYNISLWAMQESKKYIEKDGKTTFKTYKELRNALRSE